MTVDANLLRKIIEGALLAAGKPLDERQLLALFSEDEFQPSREEIRSALEEIAGGLDDRGFELKKVASGYRFQVRPEVGTWIGRLWEEKPQKYSRAMLETLALIAYRQPITRGEIEEIRGVAVSTNIIRTLQERDWVRVVGHREVPGRPAMYATTRIFLDYFNLANLEELPALAEIRELDNLTARLALEGISDGQNPATGGHVAARVDGDTDIDSETDDVYAAVEVDGSADGSAAWPGNENQLADDFAELPASSAEDMDFDQDIDDEQDGAVTQ